MGIAEDISGPEGWHVALAALAWQVDLGVSEVISEMPVNRYDLPETNRVAASAPVLNAPAPAIMREDTAQEAATKTQDRAVAAAEAAAGQAATLEELRATLAAYDHCNLKKGARNLVFADGNPTARVLILGEAPGRDEEIEGRPFVGRAGDLLDRMFAAIGLSRSSPDPAQALYITNVMPWRPPQNRDPEPDEIAMMRPFVERHIALVDPDIIVLMGNTALQAALNTTSILRARGEWATAWGKPVLPMVHPAYLLRTPSAKRDAWADLLSLQEKLRG
jgi:DNA polymerase